jgi:hypothetical protein
LLSAPAANGTFSTLFCESFPRCLSPYPGGPAECTCLVLPQRHRPSPTEKRVGFPLLSREHDFSRTPISELQLFLYVQASEFVCLPGRSHRCKFPCRAAETFTSEQNVHRCLCTHRICYPPDYRQLAERGLSPRKIHSIVDRSSQFWGALHCPFPRAPIPKFKVSSTVCRSSLEKKRLSTHEDTSFFFGLVEP